MPQLAIKIDVDTYRGLAEGGARLAEFLNAEKIPASFFVTMGPDTSGRAATRFLRHRGFAQKMQRTNALELYGLRTVLSGTLLPVRPIAASFPDLLRRWQSQGFEVGPHGYDHIFWHDRAAGWTMLQAEKQLTRAWEVYQHIFQRSPSSFAAPGWQTNNGVWQALDQHKLLYHSDTRGEAPYFGQRSGAPFQTLEIPTTLPTWDEMLAWEGITRENIVDETLKRLRSDRANVWTLHAEVEGGLYFAEFQKFISRCPSEGVSWVFLPDWAKALRQSPERIPVCPIEQSTLPGRGGTVTCQKRDVIARQYV